MIDDGVDAVTLHHLLVVAQWQKPCDGATVDRRDRRRQVGCLGRRNRRPGVGQIPTDLADSGSAVARIRAQNRLGLGRKSASELGIGTSANGAITTVPRPCACPLPGPQPATHAATLLWCVAFVPVAIAMDPRTSIETG